MLLLWTEHDKSSNRANDFLIEIAGIWGDEAPVVVAKTTTSMLLRQRPGEAEGGHRRVASVARRWSATLRLQLSSVPSVAAMHPPTSSGAHEDAEPGLLADRANPERGNRLATNGAAACARHALVTPEDQFEAVLVTSTGSPGSSASTSRHVSSSADSQSSSTVTGPTLTRNPRVDERTSRRLLTFRNLSFFSPRLAGIPASVTVFSASALS